MTLNAHRARYLELIDAMQKPYDKVKHLKDNNEFARLVHKKFFTFLLFQLRSGGFTDVWTYLFLLEMEEFENTQKKLQYRRGNNTEKVPEQFLEE